MPIPWFTRSRSRAIALLAVAFLVAALWLFGSRPNTRSLGGESARADAATTSSPSAGPPWRYGRADARFTVIEFADLECPYCRAYFAVLKRWIQAHPEVNWQWHHLPLAMHDPAASSEARLVECVGESDGPASFWQAVAWVYANTRGNGQGLPEGLRYPDLSSAAQRCLASDRPDVSIRAQAAAAAKDGIEATPTLRLQDRQTGRTLVLHGPVEGDALLSAIDLLAANGTVGAQSTDMPTAIGGDMPR